MWSQGFSMWMDRSLCMPCMFEDMAYAFGAEYGVDRKDMNINGQFLRILPGNDMELQETVIIAAVGIGLLFVSVLVVYSVFYLSVVGGDPSVRPASDHRDDEAADTQDGAHGRSYLKCCGRPRGTADRRDSGLFYPSRRMELDTYSCDRSCSHCSGDDYSSDISTQAGKDCVIGLSGGGGKVFRI